MALRCFAKCPYRAHWWDIRKGAQEGIWRYCGKLPVHGPNHHQLGPYEPTTVFMMTHILKRLITEDDMLPVGHSQVPPLLRPLQAEMTVVGSQQGLLCGSICPVTTGQESAVNRCATSPHSVQISHQCRQGPSTQETILSDHPQQCTVLPRCCLSGSPWRLAWHQRSSGSMPFEYAVDGSTSQTHTGSNSTLLNALTGKCKHLMPNTHRGWTGHCSYNQKNFWKKYANIDSKLSQCEDWFGGTTTYTVVSELDHPTWPCIECLPKVVSDFVGEQSRVHIMPISAKWKHKSSIHIGFIVFNGGCNNLFCQECMKLV